MTERIGLDLILPLATMLPFQRHLRWYEQKRISTKVAEQLLKGVPMLSRAPAEVCEGGRTCGVGCSTSARKRSIAC